jgi:uncharacterized protein
MKNKPLQICNTTIQPGERLTLALPTPEIYTCTPMHIPIHVIHGKKAGPCLLICSALHGDEANGIAIIQRLLNFQMLKKLAGTLIAVPVLNVYGLLSHQRNLPDRRDLEGSFPGSEVGSFASRLAHLFHTEIMKKATHCIDIHTGELHYKKFPQIITNLQNKEASDLAKVFQAPVIVHSDSSLGLLWQMKQEHDGIPTLIYQTGEALRLDDMGIRIGLRGVLRMMKSLDMIPSKSKVEKAQNPTIIKKSIWVESPGSGLFHAHKKLGSYVNKDEELAVIGDPFGTTQKYTITAPCNGMIIGKNNLPLTNEGEPLLQIASTESEAWEEGQKLLKELP